MRIHHILVPLIIFGGFFHSYFAAEDISAVSPMRYGWILLLILAFAVFVYHRIIRPKLLSKRPYRVVDVKPETADVWTVTMAPPEKEQRFDFLPGQFQFITFHRENHPVEEHHWTISSSPTENGVVRSTIKALGDFTATIGETKVGDTAVIHAPFGRFSYALHPGETDLVFIAGGIGVTPLMSMLRHMKDTRVRTSVLFLYGNETEGEIVFRDELEEMAAGDTPNLTLVHVIERPGDNWEGETGRIDANRIRRHCGDNFNRTFYLCGPPGLVGAAVTHLRALGVPESRIRMEIFSLL